MNRIQLQLGLSRLKFLEPFDTEAHYQAELEQMRRPQGFVCPCCAYTGYSAFKAGSHKALHYLACRHQTSLIAGALCQNTKQPLTVWFLAIYLISRAKTGLSTLALKSKYNVAISASKTALP